MPSTNFHLAPPPQTVDGLFAVPIDIQSINGSLTFDASTQTGEGDVTLGFVGGVQAGNPIFDLRQTILEAWLDGAAFAVSGLGSHNFGGGAQAELRILEQVLAAGSSHTLRLRYSLGIPQASTAGSYQPQLQWSSGPRLTFNFGFTDLGPGRYLEAWVPANLIFDQFEITLELRLLNTAVAHSIICNGAVTVLGANQWRVQWPAHSSALTTLLELRAADTLVQVSDSVVLPVSGATVSVEAWKLTTSGVDLAAQVNNIKSYLTANENNVGPFAHGNRFIAFFHTGGMEYDGGTTTGTGPLRHETFHSWWGRGLKPASHPDGWWDEAWTEYNMAGGTGSTPFSFADPPTELSQRNPWARFTPSGAYSAGREFFEGLAQLMSAANLKAFMDEFYQQRRGTLVTTAALEAHLLARSGHATVVDAFHRFVYGFGDTGSAPDLWLQDAAAHTGADYWSGDFWDSPDLWVRHADDGGLTHQNPEYGQDNWFYARVRNRGGLARHFAVSFNVKSFAGFQFVYPADFLPCTSAVADFELGPGDIRVVKARWPAALVPPEGTHACLLAAAIARSDHPAAGLHVWEYNNLAQKNLTVVDLSPGDWIVLPLSIANRRRALWPWFDLVVVRPQGFEALTSELLVPEPAILRRWPWHSDSVRRAFPQQPRVLPAAVLLECGGDQPQHDIGYTPWTSRHPPPALAARFKVAKAEPFPAGGRGRLQLSLPRNEDLLLGWRVQVPQEAQHGSRLRLHLVLCNRLSRTPLGGIALEICVDRR